MRVIFMPLIFSKSYLQKFQVKRSVTHRINTRRTTEDEDSVNSVGNMLLRIKNKGNKILLKRNGAVKNKKHTHARASLCDVDRYGSSRKGESGTEVSVGLLIV